MSDYFDALVEAGQQGHDFTSIADYHASQGWDTPPQPDMTMMLAGDLVPYGDALAPNGAPGFVGDAVQVMTQKMQQTGGSDYYSPNQTVLPGNTNPSAVNENEP